MLARDPQLHGLSVSHDVDLAAHPAILGPVIPRHMVEMQGAWIRDAHDAPPVSVRLLPVQPANRCDQRRRRAGSKQNGRYSVCHTKPGEVILEEWPANAGIQVPYHW